MVLTALVVITSIMLDFVLLPRANKLKSGRNFTAAAEKYLRRADQVYLFKADFSGVNNIFTDRVSLPVIPARDRALERALDSPKRVAVIARDTDVYSEIGNPPSIGRETVCVRVGHRNMALFVNWPEPEDR